MAFTEAYRTGFETSGAGKNPFKSALNEISVARERRRQEDLKRQEEDTRLHNLFAELDKRADLTRENDRLNDERATELEYTKGEIQGNVREREAKALGENQKLDDERGVKLEKMKGFQALSLEKAKQRGETDKEFTKGEIEGNLRPLEKTPMGAVRMLKSDSDTGVGVTKQAGLSPRVLKSPSGKEYEVVDRGSEVPEDMEIVGYDQKGRPMIRKIKSDLAAEKFNAEQKEKVDLKKAQSEEFTSIANDTLDTISKVEKGKKYFGWKSYLPALPESDKVEWDSNVNKLLSGKILETIADMKRTSKTGATGFGQLNRAELKVLTDASTALKRTMSQEQAQPYLDKMKDAMNKIIERERGGQEQGQSESDNDPLGLR